MTWAADAAGHPDPGALASSDCLFVGQYLGTAFQHYGVTRGYVDQCHAAGVGVLLIMEEWASQFLTGYDGARQSANRMMAAWDALGAPRDGSVLPVVVLVDPNPGIVYGNEQALRDYARGWDDGLPFAEWTGYGSRYGLDIARGASSKMTRRWGVRTWGFEGGDTADLIQEPNIVPPVAGTDYNTVNLAAMGQWGGSVPTPPAEEDSDVKIAWGKTVFGIALAGVVDGGLVGDAFDGPEGAYGIPQSALDWNAEPGRGLDYVHLDPERLGAALTPRTTTTVPGDCPPGLADASNDELIAELDRRLA